MARVTGVVTTTLVVGNLVNQFTMIEARITRIKGTARTYVLATGVRIGGDREEGQEGHLDMKVDVP